MDCTLPGSSVHGIIPAKYWRGLPFPPPKDIPDPWIEPASPMALALAGEFLATEPPRKPIIEHNMYQNIYMEYKLRERESKSQREHTNNKAKGQNVNNW